MTIPPSPSPAPSPPPAPLNPNPTKLIRSWIRVKRVTRVELYRRLTLPETFLYLSLIVIGAALLFALPLYLWIATNGEDVIRETLKAFQFTSKVVAVFSGVLAYFSRKSLVKYIIGLFLASFAIDFGVDTFIYYVKESTLDGSIKSPIITSSVIIQLLGFGGLIFLVAMSILDFVRSIFKKLH